MPALVRVRQLVERRPGGGVGIEGRGEVRGHLHLAWGRVEGKVDVNFLAAAHAGRATVLRAHADHVRPAHHRHRVAVRVAVDRDGARRPPAGAGRLDHRRRDLEAHRRLPGLQDRGPEPNAHDSLTGVEAAWAGRGSGRGASVSPASAPSGSMPVGSTWRRPSTATIATTTARPTLNRDTICIPSTNACRATPSSASPTWPGSCVATAAAPPRVSRAAPAASSGTPAGSPALIPARYTMTPMLPRTDRPRAPPSSAAVSDMPVAAPARSGGAEPTMSSVVRPNSGASPSEITTDEATTSQASPGPVPARLRISRPRPAISSPAPMT